ASLAVQITTLKNRDVETVKLLPNIVDAYGAVLGQKVVSYKNVNKNSFIFGSDSARFRIDKGVIDQGRPYTDQEDAGAAQVALLGSDISKNLFGNEDPIGKIIRVGTYNFEVIGVYAPRGSIGFSNDDEQ